MSGLYVYNETYMEQPVSVMMRRMAVKRVFGVCHRVVGKWRGDGQKGR